jgi:aspartyl protease family protein
MSDTGPSVIYYVLAIVLVASSLIGMRLPIAKVAKMALAWVAIFGVAFVLFAFRGEFASFLQRLRAEATGVPIVAGEEVRIPMAEDGHFWAHGTINGRATSFLVDSGASVTTLSRQSAEAAGVRPTRAAAPVSTANGTVPMQRGAADRLVIGSIERNDFSVFINNRDETNVLGMNFLSSLDNGWSVEGNYLVLRP